MRRITRLVALALLSAALAGCSATLQDDPRPIDPDDVPFGLLREKSAGPTAPATLDASGVVTEPQHRPATLPA